jgi:hypothetical protein
VNLASPSHRLRLVSLRILRERRACQVHNQVLSKVFQSGVFKLGCHWERGNESKTKGLVFFLGQGFKTYVELANKVGELDSGLLKLIRAKSSRVGCSSSAATGREEMKARAPSKKTGRREKLESLTRAS